MKFRLAVTLLFPLFLSSNNALANTCEWKYKIINLDSPDALIKSASSKEGARSGLEAAFNKLGKKNWELASSHTIREVAQPEEPQANAWVYQLQPRVALFKKQVCQ